MNINKVWEHIKGEDGLSHTLGMEFISTPEDDTLKARMASTTVINSLLASSQAVLLWHLQRTLQGLDRWLYALG